MKIAVIGAGIAGNTAAWHLSHAHEVTVFEAAQRAGGHSNTVSVHAGGRDWAIDTGFIVYNDRNYPQFCRLLKAIGVTGQPTEMSFAVRCESSGFEYCGSSLNGLLAQRRNLLRPDFWRMLRDILRFNREAPALLEGGPGDLPLGDYLHRAGYSRAFQDYYLIPMGAAIWSSHPTMLERFPAGFFVRFFQNHGLLSINDRPRWKVISGGSVRYVEKLTSHFRSGLRLGAAVQWLGRSSAGVRLKARGAEPEHFDAAFVATHADQALAMLADATPAEREVLGAFPYQRNDAVLHTDNALLPRSPRASAAWNYRVPRQAGARVSVSYNMNRLQSLAAPQTFIVTLNDEGSIDPARVVERISYQHPVFTAAGVAAQARRPELHRDGRIYFCGAYWRNGFHEDGVVSALDALSDFQDRHGHAQLPLSRAG